MTKFTRFALLAAAALLIAPLADRPARGEDDLLRRQLLTEEAELKLSMAKEKLELALDELEWVRGLPADGEVHQYRGGGTRVSAKVDRSQRAVITAEAAVELREIDLREIEIMGRRVNGSLWAPLVETWDAVGDRMRVKLKEMQLIHRIVLSEYKTVDAMFKNGATVQDKLFGVSEELDRIEASIGEIELRLEFRQLHLADNLPSDARFLLQEAALDRRERLAANRLQHAQIRLDEIKPLTKRGFATNVDLLNARNAVLRREGDLAQIDMDRRLFDRAYAIWRDAEARDIALSRHR